MFTGLIEEIGIVRGNAPRGDGATLIVEANQILDETVRIGDSIAINGACQTVVSMNRSSFTVEVVRETLNRTRLGDYKAGDPVNLERAMRPTDRLGGHLVQGHVDGMITLQKIQALAGSTRLRLELPESDAAFVVEKGSVALNGVSLTVAARLPDAFEVEIIPHTWKETTLCQLKTGEKVHVEWDLIAKYVRNMIDPHIGGGLTMDKLRQAGF
ncbi:MAG TPA: riboflavin synthase [Bacteroidetes bacterium]|nr:riboflavin synthase [bacterium BMS3Bbin04]HDO64734.1 riboflavin synthase [Bacteroidota bacterium]HEX03859.1 riboflavin synthase [Bacteroidota bacterium]